MFQHIPTWLLPVSKVWGCFTLPSTLASPNPGQDKQLELPHVSMWSRCARLTVVQKWETFPDSLLPRLELDLKTQGANWFSSSPVLCTKLCEDHGPWPSPATIIYGTDDGQDTAK